MLNIQYAQLINLETAIFICFEKHIDFTDEIIASEIVNLRMKPDDFNLIKVIGRGAFGEVQLVRHKSTAQVRIQYC